MAIVSVVPTELFDTETVDFEKLLQGLQLELRTLGGSQHILHGLHGHMLIEEVRKQAADLVGAPAFTLKLIRDDQSILSDNQTLESAGLATQNASVTLLRCPSDRQVWRQLFYELVTAMRKRRPHEARRLVDKGAGFDDQGNVLKATEVMRQPGNYAAEDDQPGSTMLHLSIREGLKDLALYLISRVDDIDAPNEVGRTPLMMAVFKKHVEVAEALIRAKASVFPQDYLGHSALVYAIKSGNDALLAQLVLAAGSASCSEVGNAFDCLGLSYSACPEWSDSVRFQNLARVCHKWSFPLTAEILLQHAGLDSECFSLGDGAHDLLQYHDPGCDRGVNPEAETLAETVDVPAFARCLSYSRWMKWLTI